jgi:hypothetical protein
MKIIIIRFVIFIAAAKTRDRGKRVLVCWSFGDQELEAATQNSRAASFILFLPQPSCPILQV